MRAKREKICGIYCWEVIMPGKWFGGKYIGQGIDILKRKDGHSSKLKRNNHENKKFQSFVNKYGINTLQFSILVQCPRNELNFWEKWFTKSFDTYKTKINFNLTKGGNDASYATRECELQNMETGEIVKCDSITEFCEKYDVYSPSVGRVLDGKSKFAGVWLNHKLSWRPKMYHLIDTKGNIYSIPYMRLCEFCKKHNLDYSSTCQLGNDRIVTHRGWKKINGKAYNYHYSEYSFLSPDGIIHKGKNLNEFARKHNLDISGVHFIHSGKMSHYKGWRKYEDGMKIEPFNIKTYKFFNPNGDVIITENMSKLARENNLDMDCLHSVNAETHLSHRGWTKYKEENIL
jgi:hypothetical protein